MDARWIIGGLVAGAAWLWWRGEGGQAKKSAIAPPGSIEVVGDSLAVGLAPYLKADERLTLLGPVTGWGVGGSIAAMWTMQIDAVLAKKPGTVIVSLGTNDSVSPDALSKFPARIKVIVDKIRAAGALPVLLATPSQLPHQKDVISAMVQTGALVLAPSPLPMQPDKVHPTPAGYKQWAGDIAEAIT